MNSNTQRALVDLLLTILSCILSFLTKKFASSSTVTSSDGTSTEVTSEDGTETASLTPRQQRRLNKALQKAQSIIPADTIA